MPDTILEGGHPRIISAKFGWNWLSSFRGEDFFNISSPFFLFLAWWPSWLEVGITGHNFGRGPSKDHSTKVWLQLAQRFLRRRLKCEMLTDGWAKKNCLWQPCLLTNWDEMSNRYRGPSIDASYQVSVHLAKRFQRRRFFKNWPIRNKYCLWRQCLLTDRDEMSNLYRGPSIDAFYQVLVHLVKRFQRLINQKQELPVAAMFVNGSRQNEQSL
jgi:hypothetical protein